MSKDKNEGVDFETVESGALLKWENVGTKLVGILKSFQARKTNMGEGNVYEVKTKNGVIPFFAPTLLHKKLQDIAIGNIVSIEYEKKTKTQGGTDLKHFKVGFAKPTEENLKALGLEIFDSVEGKEEF